MKKQMMEKTRRLEGGQSNRLTTKKVCQMFLIFDKGILSLMTFVAVELAVIFLFLQEHKTINTGSFLLSITQAKTRTAS